MVENIFNAPLRDVRYTTPDFEGGVSFKVSMDKTLFRDIIKQNSRAMNLTIRDHIRDAIIQAGRETYDDIIDIPFKGKFKHRDGWPQRNAKHIIGQSLGGKFKYNNQYETAFVAGSWDSIFDSEPRGVRGSGIEPWDKSLTEIYEEGMPAFKYKGFLGRGTPRLQGRGIPSGYVRAGESGVHWKQEQKRAGAIMVSEPGYGKGVPMANRRSPKPTHPGYPRLKTMDKFRDNVIWELQEGTASLLSDMKSRIEGKGRRGYGGVAGSMTFLANRDRGAKRSLKGR